MRSRSQVARIACVAGILACGLLPAAAGASVGSGIDTISTFAGSPVFGPVSATSIGVGGGTTDDVATVTLGGIEYAYYAGYSQNVVRRIDLATDEEQVVAGNGGFGAPTSGSPATATTVGPADSVAVDASGDMAILGEREVVSFVPASNGTYFGQTMTAGDIYILPISAQAVALSPQGNLAYSYDGVISFLPIAGGTATMVSGAGSISGQAVAIDSAGDVAFVGGGGGGEDEVQLVPASSGGTYGGASAEGAYFGISMPDAGTAYALVDSCHDDNCIANPGNGGPAPNSTISSPRSVAFDAQGDLVLSESGAYGVRFVAASGGTRYGQTMFAGDIYTIAGGGAGKIADGATATSVALVPSGAGIESSGELLTDDGLGGVLRVSPTSDDIETLAGDGSYGYDGDGSEGATAQFGAVSWVASDARGDVAIVDGADSRVRYIPAASGTYFGQPMTAGDIYTVAGNGIPNEFAGGGGNGGPATAPGATFSTFQYGAGIALDAGGDLVVADPSAHEVRFVPAQSGSYYGQAMSAGDVYAIGGPAGLSDPTDIALDAAGDVLVADSGSDEVKKVAAVTGTLTTVVAASATPEPTYIAVDAHGDIALSNRFDSVSFIPAGDGSYFGQPSMTAGSVYRIAGDGSEGNGGDGAGATSAELAEPAGLAFDAAGDLLIAQAGRGPLYHDDAVRFLPASSGTFYGQSMTVGDIYAIAGNGTDSFAGDGGPGTAAELSEPTAVAMMPGEDVLIADQDNNRVRLLSGSVPTATTGAAGTASSESDTVSGSVNPQGRPIAYHFEYGTTTAYGSSQPALDQSVGSDHAEHAESQMLTGLTPGTTYHYRIVADYDEAGATIPVFGADAIFTTAAPAGTSGTSGSTTTSTGTTTGSTKSTTTGTGTATSTVARTSPALACTTAQVALIDVAQRGSHVQITGAARLVLAGKRVSIRFLATGRTVGSATIASDGTFSVSAPLPPAKIRASNRARYEARIGSLRSLNLKLVRRMYMDSATRAGSHVRLAGHVTGSFKAGTPVRIALRVTCSHERVVATVKLTQAGTFTATVPAPTGAASQIAVYRAATTVLDNGHPEPTYTLPTPPAT
jgi:hypothetical protein